jgi:hypothetical protein
MIYHGFTGIYSAVYILSIEISGFLCISHYPVNCRYGMAVLLHMHLHTHMYVVEGYTFLYPIFFATVDLHEQW